jgi:hypothetical protein
MPKEMRDQYLSNKGFKNRGRAEVIWLKTGKNVRSGIPVVAGNHLLA